MDPLPWKKMRKTAEKNNWTLEDWQHVLEDDQSESDSDTEWIPGSEAESSDDEDSDDEDSDDEEEPSAKRHKRS
jgi:hypothetical protein